MKKSIIDVPVSMIFFNRPDTLKETFEAVKNARPTKLFLIQDGARVGNEEDKRLIKSCRDIVENVDWECEVVKIYSEKNLGCGMRIYSGIKEVFTHVDRTIILEDDIVASKAFFSYCAELLEKYKDDERIIDIAGMNHCGVNERCPNSYFFSEIGSCWGWATWKRSWDRMEYDFDYINDEYAINCFLNLRTRSLRQRRQIVNESIESKKKYEAGEKLSAWTPQYRMSGCLNTGLSAVPTYNLISNIGLTGDSTHAANNIKKIPKGLQKVFFAHAHEIDFPLKHPKYVINDVLYAKSVIKILGLGFFRKGSRRIEGVIREVIYGDVNTKKKLFNKFLKKIRIKK